jgi:tripartite-type tricarboxylate transporter receptor subunit TctC
MQFVDGSVGLGHVKSGRLRAIAWAGAKRGPALPDLPTVAEDGLAGFDVTGWYGILAPAGTPQAVIDRLHAAFVGVVKSPEIKERFDSFGSIPLTSSPQEFAAYVREELGKWAKEARASGARID